MAQQRPSSYFSAPNVPDLQDPAATDILRDHGARVSEFAAASQRDANALFRGLQNLSAGICDFRLTLSSGTPVTTADVIDVTPLYCTPYKSNRIALHDGSKWRIYTAAEMSIAGGLSASKPYDVFCYASAGVPALEVLAWTNDTTRATVFMRQDGVLVKNGDSTRRYVGTVRTNLSGNFADSLANRWVWNYYNRVRRPMQVTDLTTSWNYTTAAIRQANGSAANKLDFVVGLSEEPVTARVRAMLSNTSANVNAWVGIGLDNTVGTNGTLQRWNVQNTLVASLAQLTTADYEDYPGVGRHFLAWVEFSAATGTTTFYGGFSGIQGEIWG